MDHPADLFDFHIYASANQVFAMAHQFDKTFRTGPKVFVSEYAVTGQDAGKGSLYAALAEANFLIGIEKNSDVVEMASYAPLFVNNNGRRWNPDAIVFDSWQSYGTPSYWVQIFFKDSSGANLLPSSVTGENSTSNAITASAIRRFDDGSNLEYIDIKVVNFGESNCTVHLGIKGLLSDEINQAATVARLTSENMLDENSFSQMEKIIPTLEAFTNAGAAMDIEIPVFSLDLISHLN